MPRPLPLPANEPRKPRNELSEDARKQARRATIDALLSEAKDG